mmetsp:Transcript_11891/g.18652  ORF Transcript_11891/g.18652 Transcript_11891/m.18652 type:complete len:119 (-) Transcript_11891:234-590(-)
MTWFSWKEDWRCNVTRAARNMEAAKQIPFQGAQLFARRWKEYPASGRPHSSFRITRALSNLICPPAPVYVRNQLADSLGPADILGTGSRRPFCYQSFWGGQVPTDFTSDTSGIKSSSS